MQTLQLTMMHPKKTAHNKLKLPLRCSQSLLEITSLHCMHWVHKCTSQRLIFSRFKEHFKFKQCGIGSGPNAAHA